MATIYDQSAGYLDQSGKALAGSTAGFNSMAVNNPAAIKSGISAYMNPYTQDVIDRTSADIANQTAIQQSANSANAAMSGAFGGSRQGLVEATTNSEAQKNMGDISANLRNAGWTNAANMSAQDIQNQMRAKEASASGLLGASQQGGALAGQAFGMGNDLTAQQMQQGTFLQQMQQMIMEGANNQFGATTGQPTDMMNMLMYALTGSPMNAATTTTGQYDPGMFDYLSLAAQGVGGYMGMQ